MEEPEMISIAPSVLAADFRKLELELKDVEQGGADMLHVDIMDGHFVPNISFGPFVVEFMRQSTSLPLDVHLMIERPELLLHDFVKAGASRITVHAEACTHLHRVVGQIRGLGVLPGVAVNPATPLSALEYILEDVDLLLIMTVNPGFGGQKFMPAMLPKIRQLRSMLDARGLSHVHIQVDGGINEETARLVVEAGADVLVAGSSVFGENDRAEAIRRIRGQA